ncbi:LysM domain-containing protein [Lactobacillus johnsonii]|jgi:LysM repeat protein|uniref:LysM peptidoglycan-binding domain-containing protein n=1 Tax=Lactobacillus johnsonii TaxID=33959 RepID=UPI0011DE5227|nr:LysM domain-containing protein [Lactobacillus johnsonii]
MKENKSQDNKEPKGPYKHFERPKTSRRAMHHRESEPEADPEVTSRKSTQSEGSPKGPHHSQLWAGLIIVAIIIIALIPIVSSRLHANSNNLAEKSVKVSKSSSSKSHKPKSKKSKQSSSKKSKSKSSSVKREESSSSQSQDTTPAVVSQSESQSSQVSQSSTQSYESSASQTTTQDQSQQSAQNTTQTNQNTWQNNGGSSYSQHEAPRSYTVQEGDSLSKIARENNTSVHHLEQINDLESADSISIGQSIKLR